MIGREVIVTLALIGHNFNTDSISKSLKQHHIAVIFGTIVIIGVSAVAGFLLEILIIFMGSSVHIIQRESL
jgi:hypothetical protein